MALTTSPVDYDDQDMKELQDCFEIGGISKMTEVIVTKLKEVEKTTLIIAVIGDAGVGKSSFINAIRG